MTSAGDRDVRDRGALGRSSDEVAAEAAHLDRYDPIGRYRSRFSLPANVIYLEAIRSALSRGRRRAACPS